MENLLKQISYDGLVEGEYGRKLPIFLGLFSDDTQNERLRSSRSMGYQLQKEYPVTQEKSLKSSEFNESLYLEEEFEPKICSLADYSNVDLDKEKEFNEVSILEKLLSYEYGSPNLKITKIEDISHSKKDVKRVYFVKDDDMYQVWILKADPKQTARELNICSLVYEKGIPTAKPIGYNPNPNEDYPYDIAILGGVVEHAGDSYDSLLSNLVLSPDLMFKTALSISRLLGEFHYKLTLSHEEFSERGIELHRASPRREINERFIPSLNIDPNNAEDLIRACENLYYLQDGQMVISHGDIHTGNIVTQQEKGSSVLGISLQNFGLIDYGSLCFDFADSDIEDFWIHHRRSVLKNIKKYDFNEIRLREDYCKVVDELAGEHMGKLNIGSFRNNLIQRTLWNVYEMFDPTRKDVDDINSKMNYHFSQLYNCGHSLHNKNLGPEFNEVLKQVTLILKEQNLIKV